jgi:site-specific recombinase XerC
MDRFYGSWRDGIRSKAKKLERLKSFVKFCLKREWLHKDIADDLEAPEGSSVTVPKAPFTDEEWTVSLQLAMRSGWMASGRTAVIGRART